MSVSKLTLQQWVAGAELRVKKSHRPFAKLPLVSRVKKVAEHLQARSFVEKIDLTRAANFRAQTASEDLLFASVDLPVFGKRGIGNDVGLAVASFDYADAEGDKYSLIAVCAYTLSGVVGKKREVKKVLVIPMT